MNSWVPRDILKKYFADAGNAMPLGSGAQAAPARPPPPALSPNGLGFRVWELSLVLEFGGFRVYRGLGV